MMESLCEGLYFGKPCHFVREHTPYECIIECEGSQRSVPYAIIVWRPSVKKAVKKDVVADRLYETYVKLMKDGGLKVRPYEEWLEHYKNSQRKREAV